MDSAHIRIVLVEPSHPGNIGAVARAMKNMGLAQLVLVSPRQFPDPEASARASGADDVLEQARVVATLAEALAGCGFVAATTSRERDQHFRIADVRDAAARLALESVRGPVVSGPNWKGDSARPAPTLHGLWRACRHARYSSPGVSHSRTHCESRP